MAEVERADGARPREVYSRPQAASKSVDSSCIDWGIVVVVAAAAEWSVGARLTVDGLAGRAEGVAVAASFVVAAVVEH